MSALVVKSDGTREPFDPKKLRRSLRRAGATTGDAVKIAEEVSRIIHDNTPTEEIYRHAFALLRKLGSPSVTRYSLRRALFGLGPTGFPFEDFLARLFAAEGYKVEVRVTLPGKCVEHELDVAAYKADHSFVVESKFHARPGIKTDLQVALYCYARLLDLRDVKICADDICRVQELLLATNTKFTSTVQKYAACYEGLSLLSWNYPKEGNLHDRIQAAGVYPITVLQGLGDSQKRALLAEGVILCRDLVEKPEYLRSLHLNQDRTRSVVGEAEKLLKINRQSNRLMT